MNAEQPDRQPSWLAAHRRWLAAHRRPAIGGALAIWTVAMVAFFTLVIVYDLDFFGPVGGPWVLGFGSFAITGAVIGAKRPGHVLALLFLILGVTTPVANTLIALALGPLAEHPMSVRTLVVALSLTASTMLLPLLPLTMVLFPDGRLPSRRWRWVPWLVGGACLLGGTAAFAGGAWGGDPDQTLLGPPLGGDLLWLADVVSPLFFALIPALFGSGAIAVVLRFRRGDAVTRQQVKWLALAALVLALIIVWLFISLGGATSPGSASEIVVAAGIAFVPVGVTIAIVRHGLYDIDVVLSRTIVFVTLAGFITAVYALTVVGIGTLIGDPTNPALTIGTTALVALVFEPVRARVQHVANRAVYGRRATPYEVLTSIVDGLPTGEGSHDQLAGLATLLAEGTGARHATIWVAVDGQLRAAACFPAHPSATHEQPSIDTHGRVQVDQATHVEPVKLDGQLLGALSFERRRDDPVTPHDRTLLAQMAGQAALVLGNAQLRERLRLRVEELRASRRQLVAAQDEARRKLERDLHDGAQQQLVALKVKLGLAHRLADKEQAGTHLIGTIEQLSATTDLAVDALRTLARGIYPPLLESEGLGRALVTHAQRSPVPVDVHAVGVGRYQRQVEATVYFCVLEALRNAVDHAQATHLEVRVEDRDGRLAFEVVDDGRGFDPDLTTPGLGLTTMADRIDALGGQLTIDSTPGRGTRVRGSLPVDVSTREEHPDVLVSA